MTARRTVTTRPAPRLERGEDWRTQARCVGSEHDDDLLMIESGVDQETGEVQS